MQSCSPSCLWGLVCVHLLELLLQMIWGTGGLRGSSRPGCRETGKRKAAHVLGGYQLRDDRGSLCPLKPELRTAESHRTEWTQDRPKPRLTGANPWDSRPRSFSLPHCREHSEAWNRTLQANHHLSSDLRHLHNTRYILRKAGSHSGRTQSDLGHMGHLTQTHT